MEWISSDRQHNMNFNINISPFGELGDGSVSPLPVNGNGVVVTPGVPPPVLQGTLQSEVALRDLYSKFQRYTKKMQSMETQVSELKSELTTRERTLRKTTEALRMKEVENERLRVEVSNLNQILAREQSHLQMQNDHVVSALETHSRMIDQQRQKSEDSNQHQSQLADIVDGLRRIVLEREQLQQQQSIKRNQILPPVPEIETPTTRPAAYIQMSPPPPPPPVLSIPEPLISSITAVPPGDPSLPPEAIRILQQYQRQF